MTTLDIGLTVGFVLVMILVAGAGVLQALVATILVAYFVYPRIMVGEVETDGYFNGISLSHPVVLTWHVAIIFVFIYGAIGVERLRLRSLLPVVPLAVFSALFFSLVWVHSRPLTAGFLHLLVVCASWVVGSVMFNAVYSTRGGERVLSKWIAGVASFLALVCILQVVGFDINNNKAKMLRSAAGARDSVAGNRVISTFNEPTAAGKFLFLLAIIAVVWLFGRDARKKRDAILMVAAISVVSILTQTRTTFAGVGALLVLYSLVVSRRNRFGRMVLAGCAMALVVFASYPIWNARFSEDGGIRGYTLDVAIDYIASNPHTLWAGIGPNRYFEVLAPMDLWVSRGYPPHNYFLYLLVELGVLGTICYVVPFVSLTVRSVKAIREESDHSQLGKPWLAKAWLCSLPGLLLTMMVGWGFLSVVAPALFLVMGYIYASLSRGGQSEFQLGDVRARATGLERSRRSPGVFLG